MNGFARKALAVLLTLAVVAAAAAVLTHLWRYYMRDPWTRDAHIAADVVQVAPDVSGLVAEVRVHDNAPVHKGDVLFVVDQTRYRLAVAQAEALLARDHATLAQIRQQTARDRALKDLVAAEDAEARAANAEKAEAAVAASRSAVELARLNLQRTVVTSPVDGRVSDRTVRSGDYVSAGKPVLAVLDTNSFRVDAYFEETRLRGIHVGDPVGIHVMGEDGTLQGHVQSVAAGIEDRYRTSGTTLLPNVTPSFDWVRLAQRVPVRIAIDETPSSITLIAGRSATVSVASARASSSAAHPSASPASPISQASQGNPL